MSDLVKQIPLTQNQFALVDAENYDYLMQWKWYANFDPCTKSFYACRKSTTINGELKTIYMHRVIMNVTDPKIYVDHVNHDRLNDCKSNLRIATHAQNQANTTSRENSSSKYLGVSWLKARNKWIVQLRKDKKLTYIGLFKNESDAALAYNEKAIEVHGEFANLNLIPT